MTKDGGYYIAREGLLDKTNLADCNTIAYGLVADDRGFVIVRKGVWRVYTRERIAKLGYSGEYLGEYDPCFIVHNLDSALMAIALTTGEIP